jgi:tetrahedral aminopeptidase
MDISNFLKQLISSPGLSGYETPVRQIIEETWKPLTDELSISRIGSLHGFKRGSQTGDPRKSILIATHMDAIGMMVTRIVDGFLYVTEIGGIDARVLPGQPVTVFGRAELPAVVVSPPNFLLPPNAQNGVVPLEKMMIDTGLPARKVSQLVRPGDLVAFAQPPLELGSDILAGHSLDNRASVAALTHCLEGLQTRRHAWDVWAVATVQEEETLGGAATSAHDLRPDLAIAIDVTFGKEPNSPSHKTLDLNKGPVLGWGPNIHPGIHKALKQAADRLEMSTQFEIHTRHSGTDAHMLQVAAEGIPTMVVSIPLRYMHTPVEVIHLKDVTRVGRLLAEFIAGLDVDFMDNLTLGGESNK